MYPVWKKKKKEKTLNNEHNNIASIEMQTRWMREGEKTFIQRASQPAIVEILYRNFFSARNYVNIRIFESDVKENKKKTS